MGTGSWDFSTENWELDTEIYQSSPSSLRIDRAAYETVRYTVLYTGDLLIKEGQVIWWMRQNANAHPGICFRNQAANGTSNCANCYYVHATNNTAILERHIASSRTIIGDFDTSAWTYETWRKFKVAWWDSYNLQNQWSFTVQLWEWDSDWVSRGVVYDDNNSQWENSSINRVGPIGGWSSNSSYRSWHDDVELYKA